MATSNAETVQQSYPPPPPWFQEFNKDNWRLRPPPPLPDRTYTCFGWPRIAIQNEKKGVAALPQLDSETKMFKDMHDLRNDFKKLFKELLEAMLKLMDQLSQPGQAGIGSVGGSIQAIIKMQKNLQHILVLLRYWEAKEEVVRTFERQLQSRIDLIIALKQCLSVDLKLIKSEKPLSTAETGSDANLAAKFSAEGDLANVPETQAPIFSGLVPSNISDRNIGQHESDTDMH